jgi:hypothetical protein
LASGRDPGQQTARAPISATGMMKAPAMTAALVEAQDFAAINNRNLA